MLSAILGALAQLPGLLGQYFKRKYDLEEIRLETRKQIELEKQKLAAKLALAEQQRQEASLKATGTYFKYFTFVMWFGPYIAQLIWPPLGQKIFENMLGMPEWYAQSCVTIMFTVWGISVSAPAISNIFSGMHKFFKERRAYTLKKGALSDKEFFKKLRSIQGYVTQEQVDKYNEQQ